MSSLICFPRPRFSRQIPALSHLMPGAFVSYARALRSPPAAPSPLCLQPPMIFYRVMPRR
jgi:hypothetical protein